MNSENDYDDFEDWEDDANLIDKEDWKGLLKLRLERARNQPEDLCAQDRYGEALVLNRKYLEAIEFLTPIYKKYYDEGFGINWIMDALIGLGKTENDYNWIMKPKVLRLDKLTIDLCIKVLKGRRKHTEIFDLYILLMNEADYLTFNEDELSKFLLKDVDNFTFMGDISRFWDLQIKIKKT
jgi:hypothetical protein